MQTSLRDGDCTSSGRTPRRGPAGPCGGSVFNFSRNLRAGFHGGCTRTVVSMLTLHRSGARRSWGSQGPWSVQWRWHPPSRPQPLPWERGIGPRKQAPWSCLKKAGGEVSTSPRASRKGSCARDIKFQISGPSSETFPRQAVRETETSEPKQSRGRGRPLERLGSGPVRFVFGVGASRVSISGGVFWILHCIEFRCYSFFPSLRLARSTDPAPRTSLPELPSSRGGCV